ncbi:TIGR01906 family membrane protein [Citricoccus sp.]|uniref:TIGR01906 family membrane protein n=1 Tax=Citricoccus sp. TaxID=1978372 RepID=UPI00262B38A3|nr:TIGR01906 family membrane protein [Citricoccus sp.]HRO30900.1 TIGR01906 family membrane protein [Citricoccus sp.]
MARTSPGGDSREDRDTVDDWGGTRGEDLEAPQFESGLDYAAYVEDDAADGTEGTEGSGGSGEAASGTADGAAQATPGAGAVGSTVAGPDGVRPREAEHSTDEIPASAARDARGDAGRDAGWSADRGSDTEVLSGLDRRATAQAEAGTQPTQSIDRSELERLAAGDGAGIGAAGAVGAVGAAGAARDTDRDLPGARARGAEADVVTATARPEPEPQPASAWSGGPGGLPAPVAGHPRGPAAGPATRDPEENRRELRDAEARAAARDEALKGSPTGPRVMQVLLAVFFPVVVLIAAVRLVASPVFLWIEYHRPGFPDDPYGFTTDDRLTYGSAGMDYLFNAAPERYLGDLQHDGSALFTGTEVSHMTDVKLVMLITMGVGLLLGLLCLLFMVALSRAAKGGIRRALFAGSLWMLVVLIALGVLAVLGWQQFFAAFHGLFFAEGTWTFLASDALIRLYPNQFWIDAGLAVGVLVLLTLVLTLVFTWPTRRRRYDSRLAQEDLIRRRNDWADAA